MGRFKENKERTLTQTEFTRRMGGSIGISYKKADAILSVVINQLVECMMDGLCVKLNEFGTFGAFKQKGRIIYGGIANDRCECKDRFAVKFRPSKKLNAIVNRGISRSSTFV